MRTEPISMNVLFGKQTEVTVLCNNHSIDAINSKSTVINSEAIPISSNDLVMEENEAYQKGEEIITQQQNEAYGVYSCHPQNETYEVLTCDVILSYPNAAYGYELNNLRM